MKILADTHTFFWFVTDAPQLTAKAKTLLEAPDTERFFSLASVWEIAIKIAVASSSCGNPWQNFFPNNSQPTASTC